MGGFGKKTTCKIAPAKCGSLKNVNVNAKLYLKITRKPRQHSLHFHEGCVNYIYINK